MKLRTESMASFTWATVCFTSLTLSVSAVSLSGGSRFAMTPLSATFWPIWATSLLSAEDLVPKSTIALSIWVMALSATAVAFSAATNKLTSILPAVVKASHMKIKLRMLATNTSILRNIAK